MISKAHLWAIIQAVFVTILWSSSFVIIKFGLKELHPIQFAGLRYVIASLCLWVMVISSPKNTRQLKKITLKQFSYLFVYGILFYTLTQGTQFIGLSLLPAITVSFLLNMTTVIAAIFGIFILKEFMTWKQSLVVIISFCGVLIYFHPVTNLDANLIGLIVVGVGVLSNAMSLIFGRFLNSRTQLSPLIITTTSMTIGSFILLIVSLIVEPLPTLSFLSVIYLLWLAIINTAIAFTIWNNSQQELLVVESSIINSLMLPQITIWAILFLDENPTINEIIGIIIIFFSAIVIQLFRKSKNLANVKSKQETVSS